MLQGRCLCKISLLVIIIVALSAYGPRDFLGLYAQRDAVENFIPDGSSVSVTGQIYRKEIKNDQTLYYVKNAQVTTDQGMLSHSQFLFKFNSDYFPIKSEIKLSGRLSYFSAPRNQGEFDLRAYYNSLGVYFQLDDVVVHEVDWEQFADVENTNHLSNIGNINYISNVEEVKNVEKIDYDFFYRLNKGISCVYQQVLPEEEAGILSSIAVGNKSDLDKDVQGLFQGVGLAHVLAVSGLHVSIVCMLLYRFLRWLGIAFGKSGLLAGTVAIGYGILTGGSISAIRAIGMFLIYLLAQFLGESYDMLTAASVMAMMLLAENPLYITNGSFMMSFGAVLGIWYVALPLNKEFVDWRREAKLRRQQQLVDESFMSKHFTLINNSFLANCIKKFYRPFANRFIDFVGSTLIFSFGINLAMLPIITNLYYEAPTYSLLLNLFILPIMPALLMLGLLGGVVGLIEIGGLADLQTAAGVMTGMSSVDTSDSLWLARIILYPCHLLIYFMEMVSDIFSKFPLSKVILGRHGVGWTLVYYVLVLLVMRMCRPKYWKKIWGLVSRRTRLLSLNYFNKIPSSNMNSKKHLLKCWFIRLFRNADSSALLRVLTRYCLLVLIYLLWFIPSKGSFEIDFLDVGQGDGIYIDSGDGVRYFIDGGSTSKSKVGQYTILPFLKYKGAASIDYWFLSHMDEDHVSGVFELLEQDYEIKNIVLSSEIPMDDTLSQLLALAESKGTNIIYMKQGEVCGTKRLSFKCVYPGQSTSDKSYVYANQYEHRGAGSYTSEIDDLNESSDVDLNALSLCLLMEYDQDADGVTDFTGFFGGDIAAEQEQAIVASGLVDHVDLLKVSHHGSRFSSDTSFLETLSPTTSVISCSKTNRYGHPAAEAIDRIECVGSKLLYTMNSGQIIITDKGISTYVE